MTDARAVSGQGIEMTEANISHHRLKREEGYRAHYVDDGLVMAELGNVCVAIWRTQPNQFLFDRQASVLSSIAANQTNRIGFLCVVEEKTPAPSDKLRKASVDMLAAQESKLACVACVICDKGFSSAITRSVLSGMSLLFGPRAFPIKISDSVPHAAIWMSEHVDLGPITRFCETVDSYRSLMSNLSTRSATQDLR